MSKLLYQIGVRLYFLAISIASLWNVKAKKWKQGRKNLLNIIQKEIPDKVDKKRYWFHCASLGEFEQARPLIEALKKKEDCSVVISFFSPSGYEIRKNYELADYVTYLPANSNKNAKKFIDLIQPDVVVFIKYEFWASFIFECQSRKIPIYGVSVIFRKNQPFFKWYGAYFRKILFAFNHLFLQDQNSAELLNSIGLNDFTIVGDTRYNRVLSIAENPEPNDIIEQFKGDKKLLIAGSVWPEDMKVLTPFIKESLNDEFKIIIAPHNIDASGVKEITSFLEGCSFNCITENNNNFQNDRILILDTMGQLASAYHYGNIAYVGGAFKTGLHNVLEPAVFGLPVVFGPQYQKFNEAKLLIENGFAKSVKSTDEILDAFQSFIDKPEINVEIISFLKQQEVNIDKVTKQFC